MTYSNTHSDAEELERIKDFKNGYQPVVEKQAGYVESSIQLLSSAALTSEERNSLLKKSSDIDNALKEISSLIKMTIMEISGVELEKEARKDYHNIFTGDQDEGRLLFIQFLKAYVLLRKFSVGAAGHWTQIGSIISDLDISKNSEFKRQFLEYNIKPGIENSEIINTFCKRMSQMLKLKKEPENSRRLDGIAEYSNAITYKLSFVFTSNLNETLKLLLEDSLPDENQLPESKLEERQSRKSSSFQGQASEKEVYKIDTSGNQLWNQTPDYYFNYDPQALDRERSIFENVIYLDSHMGADQKFIKTDLILNFSRKKSFSEDKDIENEYMKFLSTFFNLVNEISAMNMNISTDIRHAFLYHLGPTSYYNLTLKFLQEVNTGTIHCKVKNGKMVRKFIPSELVKKIVLNYWREEVLKNNDFDINDYSIYKKIIGLVKTMHGQLLQKANEEYNMLSDDIKLSKNKQEIFKDNASNWIGATNIVIFKRFMKIRKT